MKLLALLAVAFFPGSAFAAGGDSDMTTLRQRLVASVLPGDPQGTADIARTAAKFAQALRPDGTWADVDYADQTRSGWLTKSHMDRVLIMSKAYRLSRDGGKADAALKRKIDLALDWWLARDLKNPNWWHDEIGIPQLAGGTALMLEPELTPKQREKVVEILGRSKWAKWTGQNLIWGVTNQVTRGLLMDDAGVITRAFDRLYEEVRITTAEGIQPDFSFHQHGAQLYNGGYGLNFAQDVARFAAVSWGTRWQIPPGKAHILVSYLLDGERWMMRGGRIDYSVVGREIVRKGKTAVPHSWTSGPVSPVGAGYGLPRAVELLAAQPVERADELRAWAASMRGDPAAPPLVGNKMFYRSDYMAHQRPGWMASVKMFSTRMLNAELVNDEGKKSQHLSDGATFLYRGGDEYLDIFPVWDWCKIPGTTAEQGDADAKSEPGRGIHVTGKTNFVGGVSDGTCGLAAMDLQRGALSAKKAWVFFDGGFVALGAGITCESDQPVATSINQCLLRGDVRRGENWVHHDGVGYVVADARAMKLSAGPQEGNWADIGPAPSEPVRKDVFNLWLDHGTRPKDATYAYTVLARASAEQTAAAAKTPVAEVVKNTPEQQVVAVRGLVAIAFCKPGKVSGGGRTIEVDRPCLVIVRRDGGRTKLAVADPTGEAASVNVTVDGTPIAVKLPSADAAGATAVVDVPGR